MKRTRYLRLIASADWSLASLEKSISMSSCKTNPTATFFCALVTQRLVASPSPMWVSVIVSLKYWYYCTWCTIVQKFGIGKLHVFAKSLMLTKAAFINSNSEEYYTRISCYFHFIANEKIIVIYFKCNLFLCWQSWIFSSHYSSLQSFRNHLLLKKHLWK